MYAASKMAREKKFMISVDAKDAYNSVSWFAVERMLLDLDDLGIYIVDGKEMWLQERRWINALFRFQFVKEGDRTFMPKCGLPQGGILSPS